MMTRFPLAPMDTLMRVLTAICLAIPVALAVAALRVPEPTAQLLLVCSAFVLATYGFVWIGLRPVAFVIQEDGFAIEWRFRRRLIPARNIHAARLVDREALRRQLGIIVRIGAGGLGGGFGYARTARGIIELWISRTDRMVFIECHGHRPLLITPADPERFVATLPRHAA